LEYLGVDRRKILKEIFNKWDGTAWTGLVWLRIRTIGGTCECGNERPSYITCGEFLD
jgi:hypothetical protein